MHILRFIFWSLCFCGLVGCGQSGPLYLPEPESLENIQITQLGNHQEY